MTLPKFARILKLVTYADYTAHMVFNYYADLYYTAYIADTVITVVVIAGLTSCEKLYLKIKAR